MKRAGTIAAWLLFAATAYMIVTEGLWHWSSFPVPGTSVSLLSSCGSRRWAALSALDGGAGHVPILILAWFMMIYPSWIVARALLRGLDTRSATGLIGQALVAAMVMTAWDTVMDPGMAAAPTSACRCTTTSADYFSGLHWRGPAVERLTRGQNVRCIADCSSRFSP